MQIFEYSFDKTSKGVPLLKRLLIIDLLYHALIEKIQSCTFFVHIVLVNFCILQISSRRCMKMMSAVSNDLSVEKDFLST